MKNNTGFNYLIEKLALNELSSKQEKRIRAKYQDNEKSLYDSLEYINNDNFAYFNNVDIDKEILAIKNKFDMKILSEEYNRKEDNKFNFSFFFRFKTVAVSSFIILLIFGIILINQSNFFEEINDYTIVSRGDPTLNIYMKTNFGKSLLHDYSTVKAGDIVQLVLNPDVNHFGVVFSIDGNGVVTLHYPSTRNSSIYLNGGKQSLHYAYQFDNAPYFETFYFISSKFAFSIDDILNKAEQLAQNASVNQNEELVLPEIFNQNIITFIKE